MITDVAAVRHRFAQLQDAARYEIRSMMVPDLAVVPVGANSAGDSCLRRGLRYRAISTASPWPGRASYRRRW